MTARKETVVCGAPLPEGGFCTRRTVAGASCGFHAPPPVTPDAALPVREFCSCPVPFVVGDGPYDPPDEPVRCLICAKAPRPDASRNEVRAVGAPNATSDTAPSDPSPGSVPEQLRLDIDNRSPKVTTTQRSHSE